MIFAAGGTTVDGAIGAAKEKAVPAIAGERDLSAQGQPGGPVYASVVYDLAAPGLKSDRRAAPRRAAPRDSAVHIAVIWSNPAERAGTGPARSQIDPIVRGLNDGSITTGLEEP